MKWLKQAAILGGVLLVSGGILLPTIAQAQGALPFSSRVRPAFEEHTESFQSWGIYCQVWKQSSRVECELSSRQVAGTQARVVWLRSTERWFEGLRFRLPEENFDLSRKLRLWIDKAVFTPEFPCEQILFEANTCAVTDANINLRLVDRLSGAAFLSAVGVTAAGGKAEVRFPLNGFAQALARMEELRVDAGAQWFGGLEG